MNKYEILRADMIAALKSGNKFRKLTLSDIIATIDKTATAGKTRVEITDAFVDEVLIKYEKTVQEMISTCPDTEKYATQKQEYIDKLDIVQEYAPRVIEDIEQIKELIYLICADAGIELLPKSKGVIMKTVMPALKQSHCDMKMAQIAIK